jgi:DNA-binding transcriptional LysR family regulator
LTVDIEEIDPNLPMDTELARTFLTVIAAGNFVTAAERLHVTQSTVSSRIHSLEDQLGCKLFVRNKAGAALTAAGKQFQKHAVTLVRTAEQARHEVGVTKGFRASLTIGGRFGLWEELLLDWIPLMRARAPDVSVRAEIDVEADLMQGLVEGRIDIGVMYTPESRPGLKVELLFEEKLVLASTDPASSAEPGAGYVYVDWGPEFFATHNLAFPDFAGAALSANVGWLGLEYILKNGGSGYFPLRLIRQDLKIGRLTRLTGAPEFTLPAYAVYPLEGDPDLFGAALSLMHELAVAQTAPSE